MTSPPSAARPAAVATPDRAANPHDGAPTATRIVVVGALCMATAMGIGRFAFTPLLPLMQQHQGLALADGALLATANYLGYLFGALVGFVRPPRAGRAARAGVVLVAASTLAMAADGLGPWLALRFVSGVASALVMIGVAGWALVQLGAMGRAALGARVFGAVGLGIAAAGGLVIVVGTTVGDPRVAWLALGVVATAIAVFTWRPLGREPAAHAASATTATPIDRDGWLLIVCYGVAGFGYIVPATFLPAAARALVNDPAVFGWVWPAFGIAAAVGTIGASTLWPNAPPRRLCASGMLVMAIGTAAPLTHPSIATLVLSAICVGGTFILVTLSGLQEIRRITQPAPARGVAALTASFALGQVFGPLLARQGGSAFDAMRLPSLVATVLLVAAGCVLLARPGPRRG